MSIISEQQSTDSTQTPERRAKAAARAPAASLSDAVESPPTGSSNALARFEYESGKTRDCTKVLMVEWEDDEQTRLLSGEWAVSWPGRRTFVPAPLGAEPRGVNRLYFLLTAGERIPPSVTLTLAPDTPGADKVVWRANALPAIFPPGLGASAREAGRKGVLHTLWAKRRLQALAGESGGEQERDWIESNFGVAAARAGTQQQQRRTSLVVSSPLTPGGGGASPRTPSGGAGRLMDKLQGLKLATGDKDLGQSPVDKGEEGGSGGGFLDDNLNPLSPEQSDVAVSSFGSFAALKGLPDASVLAAKAPQRTTAQLPRQQQQLDTAMAATGMASLDAIADGMGSSVRAAEDDDRGEDDDRDEELFALPLSPRGKAAVNTIS